MERINLREERDFGQKISDTFLFLQQNFKPLFMSLLYYAGPVSLLAGIFMGLYQSNLLTLDGSPAGTGDNPFAFLAQNIFSVNYGLTMIFTFLARVVVIGITFGYISAYLERPGEPVPIGEVWQRLSRNFVRLGLTTLLYMVILLLIAALILGLPGLIIFQGSIPSGDELMQHILLAPFLFIALTVLVTFVAVRAGLFPATVMIERKFALEAFSRSWKLVKDKWWSTFGLLVVMSIILAIIGLAFQIPLFLISIFKALLQWEDGSSIQLIVIVASVIGMLGETFLSSVLQIALGFQYFNLVERQESIGLMKEIDSLGQRTDSNANEGEY